ncbi:hypothetical protein Syun_013669 [Stephania yunnanensis]|uniref:Peptidase A1 domain-containing protein n=1 Tax=Stephania yunnanensis TaxID=152371 RepID=A0AAP0JI21_9MAGN
MEVRWVLVLLAVAAAEAEWSSAAAMAMYSSRMIHWMSDEARGVRVWRDEGSSWKGNRSSMDYHVVLVRRDLQRQKMKLGGHYKYLFPSEGSSTVSFGNDFGWLHYTWIDVGTPNVSFLVALDAGSDLLWLPCNCIQCAPLSASYYSSLISLGSFFHEYSIKDMNMTSQYDYSMTKHESLSDFYFACKDRCSLVIGASIMQDRDLSEYSPTGSSTSKHLSCSHALCEESPNCESPKQPCPYTAKYSSENTTSAGFLIEDILHLASSSDPGSKRLVQAPIIIGTGFDFFFKEGLMDVLSQLFSLPCSCGRKQSGGYLNGIAPDGLMGLGLGDISVPSFLAKSGLTRDSFSMCFNEDDSGRIFFGDQGVGTQNSTPFLPLEGKYTTYIVGVDGFCIGESCGDRVSLQALVDSGSSSTYLPDKVYEKVSKEFDSKVNATRTNFEGSPWEYCYKASSQQLLGIPSFTLLFSVNSSFVVDKPIFQVYGIQGVDGFCLALQPTEDDFAIIGQNFMTGYRIVFDRENLKLRWSRSSCQDLTEDSSFRLTPPPHDRPENPLPTNEQQHNPNGRAVSPAVASKTPLNPSSSFSIVAKSKFNIWILLKLKLLLMLTCFAAIV